ncbi:hypothetical protein HZA98_02035 [Candidatus Woesearchaeota archaeon]|nr:hypothetical protein [Candidatus Woesearchaeota archaeon]
MPTEFNDEALESFLGKETRPLDEASHIFFPHGYLEGPYRYRSRVNVDEIWTAKTNHLGILTFFEGGIVNYTRHLPMDALHIKIPSNTWRMLIVLDYFSGMANRMTVGSFEETDREFAPWAPKDNSPEVQEYLAHLKSFFRQ